MKERDSTRIYSSRENADKISKSTGCNPIYDIEVGEKTKWSFGTKQIKMDKRLLQFLNKTKLKLYIMDETKSYGNNTGKEFIITNVIIEKLAKIPKNYQGYIVELQRIS